MKDFVEKASQKISKLSDEQLTRLINILTSENEILNSIIKSLNQGIIVIDNDWHILKYNKSAELFALFSSSYELKDSPIWEFFNENEISEFLKKCHDENKTSAVEEFSITRANKVVFLNIKLQPLVSDSLIKGVIITISDITVNKQQEILHYQMEKLTSLTNIAASVAHEIKNPLGAISIHIQLLQKAIKKARNSDNLLPDEKFLENYLDIVNDEITNLNTIVLDFLFAVRPIKATMELIDPNTIITRIINLFNPEFQENKIQLLCNLTDIDKKLLIDRKLFKEVLANLFNNAKSALLAKEQNREIAIQSTYSKENFILTIADNGCGIDEEDLGKIFDPYFTTKVDGTGLGLTTVYKIIKEFSGDITVQSQKNKGTVFTITIPVPQEKTMLIEEDL